MSKFIAIIFLLSATGCAVQKNDSRVDGRYISSECLKYDKLSLDSTLLHGYVVSAVDLTFLSGASVYSTTGRKGVFTDTSGYFEIVIPRNAQNTSLSIDNTGNTPLTIKNIELEEGCRKKFFIYLGSSIIYSSAQ